MLFFKKKDQPTVGGLGRGNIPADRVRDLSAKGFGEPEMIDVLRKEGYSAEEIDKSLTSVLKGNIGGMPQSSMQTMPSSNSPQLPTMDQIQPSAPAMMPQIPETSLPQDYYYPQQQQQSEFPSEEYIDYIVKDRVGEVDRKVSEFSLKYRELESRLKEIQEQLNIMGQSRGGEQNQILQNLNSFKDSISEVDTRLSSLEKAFKETLPALIESVRALCDLVQRVKKEG